MRNQLKRLRIRISIASMLAIALCAVLCLGALCSSLISADLVDKRAVLEEIANAPYEGTGTVDDAGAVSMAGLPSWAKALVVGGGSVESWESFRMDGGAPTASELKELVALRDAFGSNPIEWGGRTWIARWQPVGEAENTITMSSAGELVSDSSPDKGVQGRVYTFLDVSDHVRYTHGLVGGCLGICAAVALPTFVVAWVAAGKALRPVADAEKREREFVCAASHELITPLMAISVNCDVLESELPQDVEGANVRRWTGNIRTAADEMAARIASMLSNMGSASGD